MVTIGATHGEVQEKSGLLHLFVQLLHLLHLLLQLPQQVVEPQVYHKDAGMMLQIVCLKEVIKEDLTLQQVALRKQEHLDICMPLYKTAMNVTQEMMVITGNDMEKRLTNAHLQEVAGRRTCIK